MKIDRKIGHAPATTRLAQDLSRVQGTCVGCEDCRGLCAALIEALMVPDLILSDSKS